ncbi:sensor histidine kinase [Cryptosporangium arvum]|uniref:histidine kinase n=1 Tax=Cryptosporangium arvum DSM 44712 TaxID=927661 RepID=A0A010YGK7_9ACTN|nr:HAMP domain-containing sensor histidine kinase [Cryptosporangium arvum]EXG79385.1 signal transduction histidine kinase [Cryptosporangium arvum DSM 44712]
MSLLRLPVRWWRRARLGTRLVALATAAVVVALALSTVVLVVVLKSTLERALDAAARQTGEDVAALVEADNLPNPIPAGGTTVVQVIDPTGRVLAASAGADRLVPMLPKDELALVKRDEERYEPGYRFGVKDVVRVVAVAAGDKTVLVAIPAGEVHESVRVVRVGLLSGYAVLLVLLVVLAWRMVGAALRPVEALRRGAEAIASGGESPRRDTGRLPLPRAQDEIFRLAVTLNTMLGRLDAARARQRAFVADAAHELRSPLASLRTQIEVAEVTSVPAEPADLLADVERLTRLVDDLLLLARMDDAPAGGHPAARRPAEPVEMSVVADVAVARSAGARVPVERVDRPGAASAVVEGDEDALTRVVTNLVENAARYAETRVEVRVGAADDRAWLEVVDDGPGIPAVDRERVFARFTRRDDARDRGSGGAGLGLAIAREIVRHHGGTIELSDASPHGLLATVRIPLSHPE